MPHEDPRLIGRAGACGPQSATASLPSPVCRMPTALHREDLGEEVKEEAVCWFGSLYQLPPGCTSGCSVAQGRGR